MILRDLDVWSLLKYGQVIAGQVCDRRWESVEGRCQNKRGSGKGHNSIAGGEEGEREENVQTDKTKTHFLSHTRCHISVTAGQL